MPVCKSECRSLHKGHHVCNCKKLRRRIHTVKLYIHLSIYTGFRDIWLNLPFSSFLFSRGEREEVERVCRERLLRLQTRNTRRARIREAYRLLQTCANWNAMTVCHEFVVACLLSVVASHFIALRGERVAPAQRKLSCTRCRGRNSRFASPRRAPSFYTYRCRSYNYFLSSISSAEMRNLTNKQKAGV